MQNPTTSATFFMGLQASLPFALIILPFGAVFGATATEAGLHILETLSFSMIVIAGATQFAAISLMQENAPTIVVLLTSLAVNLRMAMYSATLAPHLGGAPWWQRIAIAYSTLDQSFALSDRAFQDHGSWTLTQRVGYFFGSTVLVAICWYIGTFSGAWFGAQIPDALSIDFAIPICFIAMFAPALRTIPHVVAATCSIILALLLSNVPFGLGLLIAAFTSMAIAAEVERRLEAK